MTLKEFAARCAKDSRPDGKLHCEYALYWLVEILDLSLNKPRYHFQFVGPGDSVVIVAFSDKALSIVVYVENRNSPLSFLPLRIGRLKLNPTVGRIESEFGDMISIFLPMKEWAYTGTSTDTVQQTSRDGDVDKDFAVTFFKMYAHGTEDGKPMD